MFRLKMAFVSLAQQFLEVRGHRPFFRWFCARPGRRYRGQHIGLKQSYPLV